MAANGVSFLFLLAPAEVGYLSAHRPLILGGGNGSKCPDPDIARLRSYKHICDYITRIIVTIRVEADICFGDGH
jgi:hypothetical protein